ncbi:hypothetical protein SKAU_G00177890 [Synaphobranchus kaupii]|uniref:Uncharacterized protein n=1 Tax=Synaphobranchus kaupii TaxID=118154 RepID=A0A9Q1FLQ7_SYNKA|nr:hypothetical protein SKAU_G00177890 [Synaphobranchus kaupii]
MEVAKEKHLEANLPGCLLLLLNYLNEAENQMFHKVDETCLPSEVDCVKLPGTPCIVVCGSSPVTAEHFMISVDQTIVKSSITDFTDSLLLMFAPCYCLNISYPEALGTTLQFMQRQ